MRWYDYPSELPPNDGVKYSIKDETCSIRVLITYGREVDIAMLHYIYGKYKWEDFNTCFLKLDKITRWAFLPDPLELQCSLCGQI